MILFIDPGPEKSGIAFFDDKNHALLSSDHEACNDTVRGLIRESPPTFLIGIEDVVLYGPTMFKDCLPTLRWIGRFTECAISSGHRLLLLPRKTILKELDCPPKNPDKYVRAACIAELGKDGCVGVKSHAWSALGGALAAKKIMQARPVQ